MGTLKEFQDLVNDITDEELLEAAEGLLRDMVEIQNMKERTEMLEAGLSKGKRAAFWWFAVGLDQEQVDLATNTVIGRKRWIKDKLERENKKKEIEAGQVASDEAVDLTTDDLEQILNHQPSV